MSRCDRVTGYSRTRRPAPRGGEQRPDGMYDVLCGFMATFLVQALAPGDPLPKLVDRHACHSCLGAVIEDVGGRANVSTLSTDLHPIRTEVVRPSHTYQGPVSPTSTGVEPRWLPDL